MKRLATIGFLILFLGTIFPARDILELGKLPALLTHFHDHLQENSHLSFLEFIQLHYNNSQHHDGDHEHHDNLPFSCHHNHYLQFHLTVFIAQENTWVLPSHQYTIKSETLYNLVASDCSAQSIWQPPKI